jgi:hypothetical protein
MSASTRPPTFFRITVGLFVLLALFGVAIAVVLALNVERINRDGGYGWLFAAFIFLVATIFVCVAVAVSSAISLRRGEAHRRFSMVVLIGSSLVVLTFGTRLVSTLWTQWRQSQEATRMSQDAPPRVFGDGGTEIPDALVEHFRREGFSIRPALDRSSSREYIVDVADVGTRCEVLVSFRGFARGIPIEPIKKKLMEFNAASVLNEHASLAMFYPFARGKTGDKDDCAAWSVKSKEIVEPLLNAFRSYRPTI